VLLWGLVTGRWSPKARRNRQRNAAATGVSGLMRIPVPWVFVLTYLIGVGLQLVLPIHVHSNDALRIVYVTGIVSIVLGVLVAFSALGLFRKPDTTTVPFDTPSKLVTSGPYRISRNPMYVGLALIYLGVAGTQGRLWPPILLPLVMAYVDRVVIPVEERRLLEVFGTEYGQYSARVRRWL
jgi:protein-S-isoprenylcysteine O-methyltransferase Ste14